MVQTITAHSDGSVDVNTGTNNVLGDGVSISNDLQEKFNQIVAALVASGNSELHVEKDTFRQFEHIVTGGEVANHPFGTTISSEDFDWIMGHIDTVIADQISQVIAEAAATEAAAEETTSDSI